MSAPKCRRCDVDMKAGEALANTLRVHSDFPGDDLSDLRGKTCDMQGPAVRVGVWKCPQCGHSIGQREAIEVPR